MTVGGARRPGPGVVGAIAALGMLTAAGPAAASVTIGQLSPGTPGNCSANSIDALQVTISSGNSYRVPANGTITSWSTNARAGAGQMMGMKVFRKIGEPELYQAVGHDGPRPLSAAGGLNTFTANIAVKTGDVLGLSVPSVGGSPGCLILGLITDLTRVHAGNLADGGSGAFDMPQNQLRLNVSAVLEPSNTVTVGRIVRNKRFGTATVAVTVPNTGELTLSGKGVKTTAASGARKAEVIAGTTVHLTIRAKGKKRKKLISQGKVKLSPRITYTPTGGVAGTQSLKVKLRKRG